MRLLPLVVAVICALPARAEGPFVELSFDAATAKANADGKLLLVNFMASWCPPCKRMDETTWPDEAVGKWIGEHAVAIQVDVDKEPDLAKTFGSVAIPAVIILKDGKELDRRTGFTDPAELVAWAEGLLQAAKSGGLAADAGPHVGAGSTARDFWGGDPSHAHMESGEAAMKAGRFPDALRDFLWAWDNSREAPGWMGVRHSFLLNDLRKLADSYAPAMDALHQLLDRAQTNIDNVSPIRWIDWIEWICLCNATAKVPAHSLHQNWPSDDEGRIVNWYERHRDADGRIQAPGAADDVRDKMASDLFSLLVRAHRYAEAVRVGGDLRELVESSGVVIRSIENLDPGQVTDKAQVQQALEGARHFFLKSNAPIYGALVAAGEDETARAIAGIVLETVDSPEARLALVTAAIDMAGSHDDQLARWLDEAAAKGADVTALRARLAAPAPPPK